MANKNKVSVKRGKAQICSYMEPYLLRRLDGPDKDDPDDDPDPGLLPEITARMEALGYRPYLRSRMLNALVAIITHPACREYLLQHVKLLVDPVDERETILGAASEYDKEAKVLTKAMRKHPLAKK